MKNNKTNKKKIIIGIIIFAVLVAVILLSMLSCEKEYKVQLKVDGNIYLTQKLHKGDTLKNIDIPTKEGYTFIGWYVDGKEFKIDEPIDENITLEAKFTKNRYTIVIDAGNGSSVLTEEIEYKGKIEKPKTPKRTGYKFIGWYNGLMKVQKLMIIL